MANPPPWLEERPRLVLEKDGRVAYRDPSPMVG